MKIYKAIRQDHDIQRELCKKILETSGESEERKQLWDDLKKELEVHAVAEERYFYIPLIDTDEMQEDARHGIAEHHEIDELIKEVDEADMTSAAWLAAAKKLAHQVNHHLDDEEDDYFDKARDIYSKKDAKKLADGYEKTMKEYRKGWPESLPKNQS
ncbi:hemerythrin HHE cation binding domain-containing protein [Balneicella halophila]|uniref:Hemerythrin HHE cation binding domain-containing protein n=1 Tax=Balneicella halophila TaxID=1537566 RepID=A0A7L4US12_BALHA|nr:hemerythrin domain-containing protein [Balneicella halophila]PVX52449.1 hemerythrin HHE cation binding domain-containing protein [Balneicella halophila]